MAEPPGSRGGWGMRPFGDVPSCSSCSTITPLPCVTHIFFPLPWSCSFSNYCELCNCEHVMFQKCVCDSPNVGSGLPAKRDLEIFLASACDLESRQQSSPRSFLSPSLLPLSFPQPLTPSPLPSEQGSGSTLFITHQPSLHKNLPRNTHRAAAVLLPTAHSAPCAVLLEHLLPRIWAQHRGFWLGHALPLPRHI